jgi:remodeling and spacing factor 1
MIRLGLIESEELEKSGGYLKCSIDLKLKLVNSLLETQFDENTKFKQILNEMQQTELDALRIKPLGKDKHGLHYWFYLDRQEGDFRFYTQAADDLEASSWKLVAK